MKMCNHRLIALALSCLLCFTAVPITAFAVGAAGTEETMTEETGTEAVTASVEEMTETFTDASTDVETEEPPAPETKTPSVAASDTETAEPSDSEAETPPAETSDPETEEPPAETPGTETEEPPVDEPTETPPAETPAVQPEYRVQVDTVEGYHNQPVALTIRLEDVGGTGWTKLEASTEQNAPEKRTDLTEALQKDGAAPYTVSTNGTVYFFITDPAGTEHKETYTVDFLTKKKKKNNGELTQYYITDNHPAIISREDFLNVQLELTRRNSKKKVSQKKTKSALGKYCSKYALSERLVCGECGFMYRRTTWVKKGKKKVVWRCISRLEFGTKYCQHSPTISEEALHQAILQCIQKVVGDKEDILKNLRDVQENIILFSGNQITPQSLEKQIDKLQQEMSALVKIIAQGGDSEFYAAKLRQLSEQKMGLTSQLQEIQKKKMADRAQEYQYQQALLYINNEENLNLTEFNDDFIRRIIEQITVLSATQIRIRFVGGYEQDANLPLKK